MLLSVAPLNQATANYLCSLDFSSLFSINAEAASGTVGGTVKNIWWTLDRGTGVLTVGGTGGMPDLGFYNSYPWYEYRKEIKSIVVSYGITYISKYAFSELRSFTSISIPGTVKSIGGDAFEYSTSLKKVYLPASCTWIGFCAFNYCWGLTDIYYDGTASQFSNIYIEYVGIGGNDAFVEATKHYNYKYAYHNAPEMNKVKLESEALNEYDIMIEDANGNPVDGAIVSIYMPQLKVTSTDSTLWTSEPSVNGRVSLKGADIDFNLDKYKFATISAKLRVGDIELSSEFVNENGYWYGERLYSFLKSDRTLVVDEPRWVIPSLKVMVNEGAVSECETILKKYSELFAQTTNGHVIINNFDILTVPESDTNLDKEALKEKAIKNQVDICMVKNGESGASGTVDNKEDFTSRGSLEHSKGGFQHPEGVIWCPISGDTYSMAQTLCHESGHYLLGCWDEYCSAIGVLQAANGYWDDPELNPGTDKYIEKYWYAYETNGNHNLDPGEEYGANWTTHDASVLHGLVPRHPDAPSNYGVMDATGIELSTKKIYDAIDEQKIEDYTFHYYYTDASCEEKLAHELQQMAGTYPTNYTYATSPQYASYSNAGGDNVTFHSSSLLSSASFQGQFVTFSVEAPLWLDDICEFSYLNNGLKISSAYNVAINISDINGNRLIDEELNDSNTYYLFESEADDIYYLSLRTEIDGMQYENKYTVSFDEIKQNNDFIFESKTINLNSSETDRAIIISSCKDEKSVNGDYSSLSGEYTILSEEDVTVTGRLEMAVGLNIGVDYSSMTWFKRTEGEWTALDTIISSAEHGDPMASCSYSGNGTYCLMAKDAIESTLSVPTNLYVTNTGAVYNNEVVATFDDSNENISYYNIYYGTEPITVENCSDMLCYVVKGNHREAHILLDNNTEGYYFAVQAVSSNGAKSELSANVSGKGSLIDSDNDGLPDYWVNQYSAIMDETNIKLADSDGDGLINLREYQLGTNPVNPDTDGDNVYDGIESYYGCNPLKAKTDGTTDDYIKAYGTPELELYGITFDESNIKFSVKNNADGKAMNTFVKACIGDETIALWSVNIDKQSTVQFTLDRSLAEDWAGLTIEVDYEQITRDSDYSNNTFVYSPANNIDLEDMEIVKKTTHSISPTTTPSNSRDIYSWRVEGDCLSLNTITEEITANKIGKAIIKVETMSGLADECLIMVVPFVGVGYTEFDYTYINNDTEISIVDYVGDDTNVVIPNTIDGLPVTEIGNYAFSGCSSIETVEIPSGITRIGYEAFEMCDNLKTFTVGENIEEIGYYCFYGCSNLKMVYYNATGDNVMAYDAFSGCGSLEKFVASDKVTYIPDYILSDAYSLSVVELSETIERIGYGAFSYCTNLQSIDLPEKLKVIESDAFYYCSSLSELKLPSSLVSIGSYAFYRCSISDINLPDTLTGIGSYAFYNCTNLTSVDVTKSVTTIGSYAFSNCSNLSHISIANDEASVYANSFNGTAYYNDESNWENGLLYVDNHLITGKTDLSSGTIKHGTVSVANSAFYNNSKLSKITIPNTVKIINSSAFRGCTALTSVNIPVSVENINSTAFNGCTSLSNVFVYNKDCTITDASTVFQEATVLHGYENSSIQTYAAKYNRTFNELNHEHEYAYTLATDATLLQSGVKNHICPCGDIKIENVSQIAQNCLVKDNLLFGIKQGITADELLSQYLISDTAAIMIESSTIGTGTAIEVINGDGVCEKIEIVIFGDVNGDGWCDGTDSIIVSCLANGLLSKDDVSEAVYMAADCNRDNMIDNDDVVLLEQSGVFSSFIAQTDTCEVTFNDYYGNEFDFNSYDFSSVNAGTALVNKEDESIILRSTGSDTHTLNYVDLSKGYMVLIPGHTYKFSYKWENLSDIDETLNPYAFAFNSLDVSELQMYHYYKLSAPAQTSGVHTFTEVVPEDHPYVTIRMGTIGRKYGGSVIKISDICVQDITNEDGTAVSYSDPINSNGEVVHKVSVKCGEEISSADILNGSLPTMTRTGYTFAGWYDAYDANGNGIGDLYDENSVMGATDLKLYAKWIKEE